jgi:hypothetical protein
VGFIEIELLLNIGLWGNVLQECTIGVLPTVGVSEAFTLAILFEEEDYFVMLRWHFEC